MTSKFQTDQYLNIPDISIYHLFVFCDLLFVI